MSVRALARTWRPDADVEVSRRSLNRYLHKGIVPGAEIRAELANALGIPADELEPSDDDEESDPVEALMASLRKVIRATLRDEIERVA